MKIEKIAENKIKFTLTSDDLEERHIDFLSLRQNTPEAQDLFWDMLHEAEQLYGFTTSNCQLFVEAMSVLGGNFVVTVTRVADDDDFESINKYIKSKLKKSDIKPKKKSLKKSNIPIIYHFENIDNIINLSKVLSYHYDNKNTLYKYKGQYYLVFSNLYLTSDDKNSLFAHLNEYGSKVENEAFIEGAINEYGEVIINKNALKVLYNNLG